MVQATNFCRLHRPLREQARSHRSAYNAETVSPVQRRTACSSLDTSMQGQARSCGSELAREGDCSSDEFLPIAPASSRAVGSHRSAYGAETVSPVQRRTACSSLDTGMQGQARSCGELAREGDGSGDEFLPIAPASSRASEASPGSLPQVCVQFIHYAQPHWRNTNCPTKRTACSSLDTGMQGQARSCGSELAREGDGSDDEFLPIAPASSRASSLPQVCVQCINCAQPHRCNTNCPTKRTACSSLSCSLMQVCRVRRARPRRW